MTRRPQRPPRLVAWIAAVGLLLRVLVPALLPALAAPPVLAVTLCSLSPGAPLLVVVGKPAPATDLPAAGHCPFCKLAHTPFVPAAAAPALTPAAGRDAHQAPVATTAPTVARAAPPPARAPPLPA